VTRVILSIKQQKLIQFTYTYLLDVVPHNRKSYLRDYTRELPDLAAGKYSQGKTNYVLLILLDRCGNFGKKIV